MRYGVGIDLGTSFTSAAVSGQNGTRMVPLGPAVVVPSVAYRAPDGRVLTGQAAQAAVTDPAGVARGFKRRLGDPTPLVLGGTPYSATALMAAQLRDVLSAVTRSVGAPPASIVLTCPAIWGPYRREHFSEVPKLANVADYRMITEPEAAATHYSAERRLGDGEVVAVYDLGGGTFDSTILRMRAGGMEILGTPEGIEHLGGIDFDETLLAHVDERLDGAISGLDATDPRMAAVLAEIRAMCVRAKEELSIEPDVRLSVPLPTGPKEVTVTRLEFNDMIRPSVQLTTDALRRTIASAGLRPDDLSAVLLAGGSSRIPLVSQLVSQEFGKPVRVTLHPKFTVALGAAAIAASPAAVSTPPHPVLVPVGAGAVAPAGPPYTVGAVTSAPPHPVAGFTPPGGLPYGPAIPPGGRPGPGVPAPKGRKRWLVPAIAAALAVATGAALTVLFTSDDGRAQAPETTPSNTAGSGSAAPDAPSVLPLYDGEPVAPWTGYVASDDNWGGTAFVAGEASQGPISAAPNGQGGLRVTWPGNPAQVYLQTAEPQDLMSYVDSEGALVFDVIVHQEPEGTTTVAAHCVYPCAGVVPVTDLLREFVPGRRTTVKIPLSCFVSAGLAPDKVDTPFLVHSEQRFDATFFDVRWEPGAATDDDATPCD